MADNNDERIDRLIKELADKNEDIRWSAAYSLGEIGDPRTVEPLIKALGDEDWNVRWTAARSLGDIDGSRVVEPLIKALEDGKKNVRWAAAAALGKMPLTTTTCQEIKPLLLANVLTSKDKGVRNASKSLLKKCRQINEN